MSLLHGRVQVHKQGPIALGAIASPKINVVVGDGSGTIELARRNGQSACREPPRRRTEVLGRSGSPIPLQDVWQVRIASFKLRFPPVGHGFRYRTIGTVPTTRARSV